MLQSQAKLPGIIDWFKYFHTFVVSSTYIISWAIISEQDKATPTMVVSKETAYYKRPAYVEDTPTVGVAVLKF